VRNPQYNHTFVFDNDYPALLPECNPRTADPESCSRPCRKPELAGGVLLARHDLTLPRMTAEELRAVVDVWAQEMASLETISWVRYVQIFENRARSWVPATRTALSDLATLLSQSSAERA